ncbi:MAG TPA: bifunctional protein-disulfide isomerase/oxidoreductase DsbC [Pseudomonas xinjiangensis]|uniref:Thiol:disulfide interchange protein n=2 Tax=root TaxID=1 RepID=A0A7V1BN03_9GAMM|nr:bifunctional protein-disulfide isomerase/oxidoreductase DsbC [Halopseudomonas xinjiangensis]HEC46865.1 bifunctional protein-disulfide isomerase/oxidoreductase DsbC [Halopseudomonas xinjiangensis]
MRLKQIAIGLLVLCTGNVWADAEDVIRASLAKLNLEVPAGAISETPISGLYQVQMASGRLLYASADGNYMVQGAIFDVSGEQPRNLTAEAEARGIAIALQAIPASELITFSPAEPKTHVTIFTDVDCGYCRKLHSEVEELNELGIEVRYAAFPRSGMGSETASTMESVWCADDPNAAMTRAKQGKSIKAATCDNPVAKHFDLGRQFGVQGTPAIFMANGTLVPGYKPAKQLAEEALANQ